MMSFAVRQAMQSSGAWWPAAHRDSEQMAALALEMQRATGFDNVAVPFCMTVEAEALGAEVNYGGPDVQPRIAREPLAAVDEVGRLAVTASTQPDRRATVLQAIRLLRERAPKVAMVAATVGPFSLAAQVVEASLLLRALHRQPAAAHRLLERVTDFVRAFALDMVTAGADVVMVADPSATGEILGARGYAEFAAPYQDEVIGAVSGRGTPVILHVCGDVKALHAALAATPAEAVSVDETASLGAARGALAERRLMGNISALVLETRPRTRFPVGCDRGPPSG
jgi:[methyl-Co(III) methanol-specific corrinoid protein]:coenzyme M methyltransferase